MRQVYFFLLFMASGALSAQSGDTWTLERAVEHALTNNIQVKQLANVAEIARLNRQQALNSRLPTANGATNIGLQFGRTIDPTTNSFNQQTIGFQGYQVQAGVTLYNGGLIKSNLRQAELNLAALIKAGALPPAQRFDLVAQRAANQRTIVDLENQLELAELGLKILLELDPNASFEVITPELNPSETELFATYDPEQVYTSARGIQPVVAAAEVRRDAAEMGIEIARAGLRPTVSLFGSLSTNFSTASKDFSNPTIIEEPTVAFGMPRPVQVNGMEVFISELEATGGSVEFSTLNYFDQLDRNFGQSAGMSLNVPIYSQGRNKINVQRAKVQRANAMLDIEQAGNQLRNDIELALANLRGAQETYRAAQASEEAAKMAYENAQRSYRAGAANSLELVTATNRFEQAQTELTRSKYQLIFNRQVIRFYLGQGFSLD